MKIILLSGGAGKRLWPLSTEILPKQFHKVIRGEEGSLISMVQKTWKILAAKFGADQLYVASGQHTQAILREQLGTEANLILEPSQRDTFPAIALATSYLASIGISTDETVVVLPVDAYVDAHFYAKLTDLDHLIQRDIARLALVGIQPTFPSEKFGYIVPGVLQDYRHHSVTSFHEKPSMEAAAELISQGALWNGGVFAFRLGYMENFLTRMNYPWLYSELLTMYATIPRISFDYMIVEPEKRVACIKYEGRWTDLGTWAEMVRVLGTDDVSNVIKDSNCEGTHVINYLDIPIVIAGIKNAVIAAGPDGILITDMSVSHMIKPLV
ncbi:MAG: hypothetical protein K0R67_2217, partial [Paenibacillus sp.]|nr:hypothetical protein [Paenibacillus sp.]